jgi:hypothetical protein
MTQSQCPIFLFFKFINLFLNILMYYSSADFSGLFQLEGKSRKTLDIIIPKISVFFFSILVLGGGGWSASGTEYSKTYLESLQVMPITLGETCHQKKTETSIIARIQG